VHSPKSGPGSTTSIRLRFDRLVAYSTNQLPLNMAALPVVLNVSHFYGEVLKVPLGIMGLIFITTRVIDAIQDPVIGLISDKFTHRGPRGRLTFVALMLPLLIGGFYMLFHPPESLFTQPVWLATWLFVALFVVHLGYAGVSISYHAHGAELTDDYNERTRVTVGREVFGLIGMTLAVVLPTYFTAQMGEHAGYVYMGLIFIPIAVLFSLPTLLWSPPSVHPPVVRENPEIHVRYFRDWLIGLVPWLARPTRNMERSATVKTLIPFFAPLKNKLFRRLLLVFIVNGAALGVAVSVMLFYVEHVLKGNKLQAGIILLVYFGAAAASVPLWMLLSQRYSKTTAWFIAMVLTAVSMSSGSCRSPSSPASASGPTTACHRRSSPTSSTPTRARTRRATPAPISACGRCRPSWRRPSARPARCPSPRCWGSILPRGSTARRR
jgi:Na+/melibiose symporter-like transporter